MRQSTLIIILLGVALLAPAFAHVASAQWTIAYLEPANVTQDEQTASDGWCYTVTTTTKKYYNLYVDPPDRGYLLIGINNPNPKYKIVMSQLIAWKDGRFAGDSDVFVALSSNKIYNVTAVLKHVKAVTHCRGSVGFDWYRDEVQEVVSVSYNVDNTFKDYEIACRYSYYKFVDNDNNVNKTRVNGEPCGEMSLAIAWDNSEYRLEDILVQPPEDGSNDSGVSGIVTQDEPPVDRLPDDNSSAWAGVGLAAVEVLLLALAARAGRG